MREEIKYLNMGMYTELILGAKLKQDTPAKVIDILSYMTGKTDEKPKKLPNHEFFRKAYWEHLFKISSYYFGVSDPLTYFHYDIIARQYIISTRSNIKNYDDEIETFLDWLNPYLEHGSGGRDFYAIVCYEEQGEPDIYYLDKYEE